MSTDPAGTRSNLGNNPLKNNHLEGSNRNSLERRKEGEAHISTEPNQAQTDPRIPRPHGDTRRPPRSETEASERQKAPGGIKHPDQRLTRARRILRSKDFERVIQEGRLARHSVLWLYTIHTEGEDSKLGIIVGKAVGKAIVRNRTRRRLREIFRLNRPAISGTFDIVLRARPGIHDVPTRDLDRLFHRLCSQVGIQLGNSNRQSRQNENSNRKHRRTGLADSP